MYSLEFRANQFHDWIAAAGGAGVTLPDLVKLSGLSMTRVRQIVKHIEEWQGCTVTKEAFRCPIGYRWRVAVIVYPDALNVSDGLEVGGVHPVDALSFIEDGNLGVWQK